MSSKTNFAKLVVREGAVGLYEKPKILASKKPSSYYINMREPLGRLFVRDQITSCVIEAIVKNGVVDNGFDTVLGVTEGAIKLGDAVSEALIRRGLMTSDQLFQLRLLENERKTGVDKYWVGGKEPGSALVVEDTLTTGGQAWEFICRLRDIGIEINDVVGLVDRLQLENGLTVEERFAKEGIRFSAITTSVEVLGEFFRQLEIENPELAKVFSQKIQEEYRREYEDAGRELPISLQVEELK
jgi:orotate phosphoribosyltransferase